MASRQGHERPEPINELASEEHELFEKETSGQATDADRERLKDLDVRLDQCWDLLTSAGPTGRRHGSDDAEVRDEQDRRADYLD